MLEIIVAGGWVMVPLVLCSIAAVGIIAERFFALRAERIAPSNLLAQVLKLHRAGHLDTNGIQAVHESSPLGRILAAGLANQRHSRDVMKESIEDAGRQVVAELNRFMNALGTIASVSPLLGLLGTVLGMINMFTGLSGSGGMNGPSAVAGGIAEALITTATGLIIAIPAVMFYRYFRGRVDALVLKMEADALRLVEIIHGEREQDPEEAVA